MVSLCNILEGLDGKVFGGRGEDLRSFGDMQFAPFFGVFRRKEIVMFLKINAPSFIPFGIWCNTFLLGVHKSLQIFLWLYPFDGY